VLVFSILALGIEPKRHLTIHLSDGIPVHADVPTDGVGVAPGPLHGIREIETGTPGRGVQRFGSTNGERDGEGLTAPAEDALFDLESIAILK